jgi:hypothetical protein
MCTLYSGFDSACTAETPYTFKFVDRLGILPEHQGLKYKMYCYSTCVIEEWMNHSFIAMSYLRNLYSNSDSFTVNNMLLVFV